MADRPVVSPHAVAALFLERQHLRRPRERALTPVRLLRFAEDVGGIQLDSINVVDRAHYLTLWSRFGPYDRARFDRLVYGRRLLFEYWAHAACLVPSSMLPFWKRAMLDYELRHTGWTKWLRKNDAVVQRVTDTIRTSGPMRNADFEGRRPGGAERLVGLEARAARAALPVDDGDRRRPRAAALPEALRPLERALPQSPGVAAVSADAFALWHVERSLHAMGAATEADLRGYLTYPALRSRSSRAPRSGLYSPPGR